MADDEEAELQGVAMAMASGMRISEEQKNPPPSKPLWKKCHQILNRKMRIGVSDGRFFLGKFHCLDKQGNIILQDTVEWREKNGLRDSADASSPPSILEQRNLGLVLIPARHRTSCLIEGPLEEQFSLFSLQER